MAPGAKFSTNTSARRAKSLTSCSPRGVLRLAVIDFLLALKRRKYQESPACPPRNAVRPGSPPPGFSTLTTSAPSQASASVHEGPASNCVRSSTRTPARQLRGTLFSVIRANSAETWVGRTITQGHSDGEQPTERVYRRRGWHNWPRHPKASRNDPWDRAAQPTRGPAQGSFGAA